MSRQVVTPTGEITPEAECELSLGTQEFTLRAMAKNYAGGHCWDHLDGEACEKAANEITSLRAQLAAAEALLRQHHKWHLDAGVIGLQDGEGGWIEIDNAAEYSDSLLYDNTAKALEGVPPEDAEPMPRGGISAWWWQVGVLERRKRRAAEAKLATATKALEENEEYWKAVHDLVESARETVRLKIVYDKRPPGLFQDLQNAVYICRGRNVEALRSLTNGAKMEQSSSQ